MLVPRLVLHLVRRSAAKLDAAAVEAELREKRRQRATPTDATGGEAPRSPRLPRAGGRHAMRGIDIGELSPDDVDETSDRTVGVIGATPGKPRRGREAWREVSRRTSSRRGDTRAAK